MDDLTHLTLDRDGFSVSTYVRLDLFACLKTEKAPVKLCQVTETDTQ